jgi:succinate dehydrogenase hydrophobic anchor subunit
MLFFLLILLILFLASGYSLVVAACSSSWTPALAFLALVLVRACLLLIINDYDGAL